MARAEGTKGRSAAGRSSGLATRCAGHHAAFDAHLIGIDADYRLHVSDRLLDQNDGPMLEALKRLNGGTIHLPGRIRTARIGTGWRMFADRAATIARSLS